MPSVVEPAKASWADQVADAEVPPSLESYDHDTGLKTVIEYKLNADGKLVKETKVYKVEKIKVSKSIAKRKTWRKFGAASHDPPGPNTANTIVAEDVFMQFVHTKEAQQEADEDPLSKLKGQKIVQCRICKGDHWTTKCPYKDTLQPLQESLQTLDDGKGAGAGGAAGGIGDKAGAAGAGVAAGPRVVPPVAPGKYVPPSLREGASRGRGEAMSMKNRDDTATIRVTNLSEDTREADLQELFRPFGTISRIYLAKDKKTGASMGFAFINFHRREDAARAIAGVSGFGYDHLILKVEWAKPSGS